ncbi:MAG: 50S ribosome-binding protein YggL [Deltaproteobacteria bacterium]
MENTPKIIVQLDCCAELNNKLCSNLVERFQKECLNPIGLLFEGSSTDSGWSGTVNPQTETYLTEKHRESIADWLFQQHEICTYAVSRLCA